MNNLEAMISIVMKAVVTMKAIHSTKANEKQIGKDDEQHK